MRFTIRLLGLELLDVEVTTGDTDHPQGDVGVGFTIQPAPEWES